MTKKERLKQLYARKAILEEIISLEENTPPPDNNVISPLTNPSMIKNMFH